MKALHLDEAHVLIDKSHEAHVMVNYRQRIYFYIDGYPLPGAAYLEDWEYVHFNANDGAEVTQKIVDSFLSHCGVINDQYTLSVYTEILNENHYR